MTHLKSPSPFAFLVAMVVAAAMGISCGSAAGTVRFTPTPAATATATPDATMRPISDTDAVNLTLQAAEFDPMFAGYQLAKSTGPLIIPDSNGDPCNAELAATLKRLGFERGYNRDWVRPDGASRDLNLSVGSYVEIYPDANAAHAKFEHDRAGAVNPPTNCYARVESHSTFDVTRTVGEEAYGYRLVMPGNAGVLDTYTWVEFRRGRIVASTDVIRGDSRDTAVETEHYAQEMDTHILHVLSAPE